MSKRIRCADSCLSEGSRRVEVTSEERKRLQGLVEIAMDS